VYGVEIVRTEVNAHALYHVRNRNYSPTFGRWNQKDPNASAQPVIDSAGWYHGVAPSAVDITFSHEQLFGDGSNLFEYVGGNALVPSDELGLYFGAAIDWFQTETVPDHIRGDSDPFRMVDEYLAEDAAGKVAFLQPMYDEYAALVQALIVTKEIISFLPVFGTAIAVGEYAVGSGSAAAILWSVIPAGKLRVVFASALKIASKSRFSVWALDPKKRGFAIEKILYLGSQLPKGFPTIDVFKSGVAISVKSIDLSTKSYQSIASMTRTIGKYIDDLSKFSHGRRGTTRIAASSVRGRVLHLVVRSGSASAQHLAELERLSKVAVVKGVRMIIDFMD
jgi:hypothetical protein